MFGSKAREIEQLHAQIRRLRRENIALSNRASAVDRLLAHWEARHVPAWITNALRDTLH